MNDIENDKEFKRLFWEWFDALPRSMKEKFWYYKDDMATTNFYFSTYKKWLTSDRS